MVGDRYAAAGSQIQAYRDTVAQRISDLQTTADSPDNPAAY